MADWRGAMQKKIEVDQVDRMDGNVVIVAFSDGTSREYEAEMLHALPKDDAASAEPEAGTQILPQA